MKKIKFAAQILVLVASFPVLFVSGISHDSKKVQQPEIKTQDSLSTKRLIYKEDCICSIDHDNHRAAVRTVIMKH